MTRLAAWWQQFTTDPAVRRELVKSDGALIGLIAVVDLILHLLVANNYGYFRDELYYLVDGRHPAFGYVDQPPLIGWLAWLTDHLFHDNLFAIHIIPALAGAAVVVIAGVIAGELGADRFGKGLAAVAVFLVPTFLATASIFSMDILDALFWSLAALVLIRLLKTSDPHWWLWFGAVTGVGLLNKLTVLFLGFAVVAAFLMLPQRKLLLTWWALLGGAIAFVCLLPYIVWNWVNGWPTFAFWQHYGGLSGGGPIGFLANQIIAMGPFNMPLTIAGLIFFLRQPAGKMFRPLGVTYIVLYVILTLINAKSYFLAPSYTWMIPAGAVAIAQAWSARGRYVYAAVMIAGGALLIPLAMPLLPPAVYAKSYASLTGLGSSASGQQTQSVFPQYLGDRFGWDTMTAEVARVYHTLPASEQRQACIVASNYGEASALLILGANDHLPPVISGHNNFYLWGPGTCSGKVIITVGFDRVSLMQSYTSVTQSGTVTCVYCQADENDLPVYVATGPTTSVALLFRSIKHFD